MSEERTGNVLRSGDHRKRAAGIVDGVRVGLKAVPAKAFGCAALLALALFSAAPPAWGQVTPSLTAPAAYNAQPGTVPVGVGTGAFNANGAGDLLDFAVLEQNPASGLSEVEIFHGRSDGSFCTNCANASPNPDVIPLVSSSVNLKGYAIAVGQFRASGPLDIAVATSAGIVILQNDGSGNFSLQSPAVTIPAPNGFVSLVIGLFHGDSNYDIAAVSPAAGGSVSFTVYFGDGSGTSFTASSPYTVSSTYSQCSAIMQGNFQGQAAGSENSDLALLCNNASFASVLVYLNSGSGALTLNQTLNAGNSFGGVLPGVAVWTLNNQAAIFISSASNSFLSYQSNDLAGLSNTFTSVSMIPVGLAPRGSLAILNDPLVLTDDFATSGSSGVGVSTFTSYTQSGNSVNGTWSATKSLGPGGSLATGFSNLTQPAYVVVAPGVHTGSYEDPNVLGPPNFEPYVDERSLNAFLVTVNADGTVATTNAAPVYSGTGQNGYSFPPSFATGDFTGDGKMDLAVGGADPATGDATLSIYLANPTDGSLPATTSSPASVVTVANTNYAGADAVVAGTFRTPPVGGKTLYDLAVFSSGKISIFTSNGDGSFNPGAVYSVSGDPNYPGFSYNPSGGHPFAPVLTAVDVDGDGLDDLVLTLPEDNCNGSGTVSQGAVYVLISNGDGTFQSPVFVPPPVVNPVSVTAAKFLGPTSLSDLVFANGGELCSGNTAASTGAAVGILQNNSTLTALNFTGATVLSQTSDLSVPDVTAVASVNLNGGTLPDVVVSGTNGIQVLLNQGGGLFNPTTQGVVPLYAGDVVPGPLCDSAGNYVGCVTYDSQIATGSFFTAGETDVAASVNGVAYIFQNSSGTLLSPTQGFVAGPDSSMISAALTGSNGLNGLLVATSQGTAYLVNSTASTVPPPLSISPTTVPGDTAGVPYSQVTFAATGGTPPFTFTETGLLPTDMTFSSSLGTLSGTPTQIGPFSITVTATDSTGATAAQNYSLVIGCPTITLTPSGTLSPATERLSYSPVQFAASGGIETTTFTQSGAPAGISISSAGLLTGTPTQAGNFSVAVTATDSNGCTGSATLSLTVASSGPPPPVTVPDDETIHVSDTPGGLLGNGAAGTGMVADNTETIHVSDTPGGLLGNGVAGAGMVADNTETIHVSDTPGGLLGNGAAGTGMVADNTETIHVSDTPGGLLGNGVAGAGMVADNTETIHVSDTPGGLLGNGAAGAGMVADNTETIHVSDTPGGLLGNGAAGAGMVADNTETIHVSDTPGGLLDNGAAGTGMVADNTETIHVSDTPGGLLGNGAAGAGMVADNTETIHVSDTPTGNVLLPNVVTMYQSAVVNGGEYDVTFKVSNTGTGTANNVAFTASTLVTDVNGTLPSTPTDTPLPTSLGNIAPGSSVTVTLTCPITASDPAGSVAIVRMSGTFDGGNVGGSCKIHHCHNSSGDKEKRPMRVYRKTPLTLATAARPVLTRLNSAN